MYISIKSQIIDKIIIIYPIQFFINVAKNHTSNNHTKIKHCILVNQIFHMRNIEHKYKKFNKNMRKTSNLDLLLSSLYIPNQAIIDIYKNKI